MLVLFWRLLCNILVTIWCLPNSVPSCTETMFHSMLLAVLIAEYPSPFLYKLSKNLVPSLTDALEISTGWVFENVVHCLKYILYCFVVLDAQESKISFSTSKFKWFLFHRLSKLVSLVFSPVDVLLLVGLVSKGWFPYEQ